MERIKWWWNLVYYFHIKWYSILGKIICSPINFLLKTSPVRNFYNKRGVNDIEKTVDNALKQAQISETGMRLYLSTSLCMPLFAALYIIGVLLCEHTSFVDFSTFITIGIFPTATIAFCPIQNYLLGKNDEYRKYFKEFDKMFKNNPRKKWLYGPLCFLIVVALYSTFVYGFIISDFIKNG